jgi:hypothetical protein
MDDQNLVNDLIDAGASDDEIRAILAKQKPASPGARFADPNYPATVQGTKEEVRSTIDRRGAPSGNKPLDPEGGGFEYGLQQLGFGTQDDLAGAIGAAGAILPGGRSPSQAFAEDKEAVQSRNRGFGRENPKTALTAKVVGIGLPALASGGGTLPAQMGTRASLGALLRQGAKAAAPISFAQSAGDSEGSLMERVKQTAVRGTIGTLVGGLIPVAARGVSKLARGAMDLTGRTATVLSPKGMQKKVGDTIEGALSSTGQSVDDVVARGQTLQAAGHSPTTADALGPAAKHIVKTMTYGLPDERAGQGLSAAGRAFQHSDDLSQTVEGFKKASKTGPISALLYKQAETKTLTSPKVRQALLDLDATADNVGVTDLMRKARDLAVGLAKEDGRVVTGNGLSVLEVDYLKKGLDAAIQARQSSGTPIPAAVAEALQKAKNKLLDAVDNEVTVYGQARAQAAIDITARKALNKQQKKLAPLLEQASAGSGKGPTFETVVPQGVAKRTAIAVADFVGDVLTSGVKKTKQAEARDLMRVLRGHDPTDLMRLLQLQTQGANRVHRATTVAGRAGGSVLARALGGQ